MRARSGNLAVLGVVAVAFGAACDDGRRPHHGIPREEATLDAEVESDAALYAIPHDPDPSVVQSDPVDIGTSLCPGVRLYRVDRRRTADSPAGAPQLNPRFFGRTEFGQVLTWRDVLLCELRLMHWVLKPRDEGAFLILWRGPAIFEPDTDCIWREPFHSERLETVRRLTFHEHCHRHDHPTDRMITIDVDENYRDIWLR